jgi:diguanylate cyclase (GGDEF)-like protein
VATITRRAARAVLDYLPKGQTLPEVTWRVRHRTLSYLLRAHVAGIFVFALIRGDDVRHAAIEAALVAVFALLAVTDGRHRRFSSAMTAFGLITSSAVLVHLSGGSVEMHFHFFVMVGIMTLYQDWLPFLVTIGYVVVHHAGLGLVAPHEVFNHPAAIADPLVWALIHGAFVLAASAASVVAWRLNEEQALKDALTRLPNRTLFGDRVSHALARSARNGHSVAVLFIDLDGFKDVNDSLGHAAGDELLKLVADRLRSSLRPGDTAARLGGDEFAVLIETVGDDTVPAALADRLLEALSVAFAIRGKELRVGASIGISVSAPGQSVDDVLRNADVAMYTVKNTGRGRRETFAAAMHDAVVERVRLEEEVKRALDRGEFVVFYQPVVSLATGRVAGLEALVRWQHPTRGLLAPAAFLDAAEQTGAIVALGAWVLEEACRQAAVWKQRYPSHPFTMAVNLSPTQLLRDDIVDSIGHALRGSGLEPSDLVLEVTEGVMVDDTAVTVERLHALKELGVQLAIDDFGTGYSSLSYLRRLPFDILKIDKLFVDGLSEGAAESAFAGAIIKLAQTLQLETVAEGVEHAAQVDKLRHLGCELAQGYRFAKPLHADGVDALFGSAAAGEGWVPEEYLAPGEYLAHVTPGA